MKDYKVGIALGGGGSRGFAHLGVLKALQEQGIVPEVIAGSSAGSIIGALFAAGKAPDAIFADLEENTLIDFARFGWSGDGLMSLDYLRKELEDLLPGKTFADLQHPLYVTVSNLLSGEVEYLHEGEVAVAVQASSAIPVLFAPVEIAGEVYVDGGLLDNVPVAPLVDCCDKIIAVDIMPLERMETVEGMRDVAVRTFQIAVGGASRHQLKESALLIQLNELAGYHILDTSANEEMYNIGYEHVKNLDLSDF